MILAAGFGERMRPLTEHCPKPLLSVGGKPLIDYHLEKLAAAGLVDVVINSAWLSEQIVDHVGDGSRFGLSVTHAIEPEPLETAGGIINALPLLGDGHFVLVNSDIWTDLDFSPLMKMRPDAAHFFLTQNPPHHTAGDFSIAADGGLAPREAGSSLTYMGVSVWNVSVFSGMSQGRRALRPVIDQLMARGCATASAFHGRWWDIGTPTRLAEIDDLLTAEARR